VTLPAIMTSARTLGYYTRLQEVTANNLANVSSDAYKGDRITAQSLGGDSAPTPVHTLDLRQGTLRDTTRPLDVALAGEGFLVVRTAQGERLTRGGSLEVSRDGFLVDRHGDLLLGEDGPLHVAGQELVLEADGTVVVDGARAGRLRLETVADASLLRKEGEGRFAALAKTLGAPGVQLRQRAIEDANVSPLLGTVDLIMIQRAYAANTEALRTMDGVLGTVTGDIGRV
jgi:flagellar basal-body rod protein FlgG